MKKNYEIIKVIPIHAVGLHISPSSIHPIGVETFHSKNTNVNPMVALEEKPVDH